MLSEEGLLNENESSLASSLEKNDFLFFPQLEIAVAFGPLVIHESGFGIDLRPANPFNKAVVEETESCCGQPPANVPKIFVNQI